MIGMIFVIGNFNVRVSSHIILISLKMCFSAKASFSAWWLLAIMAVFLWYRNEKYDRALSGFVLALGFIQLIEWGIHTGADSNDSGRALYMILWLQCLLLGVGVFLFVDWSQKENINSTTTQNIVHIIAGINLLLFAVVFIIALILSFTSTFSAAPGSSGHIEWYKDGGFLLGSWGWLYIIGIFGPLILIFAYYMWADIAIAILIIYGALSAAYVLGNYPPSAFSSMWCYLSLGFAFLAYFLGIIPCTTSTI